MSRKSLPIVAVRYLVLIALVFSIAGMVSAQAPLIATDKKVDLESSPQPANPQTASELPGSDKTATSQIDGAALAESHAGGNSNPGSTNPVSDRPATPSQTPTPTPTSPCSVVDPRTGKPTGRQISADVVGLPHPIMLNRLGAVIPDALVFALRSDTTGGAWPKLRNDKRPRPIVLRANVGDCLTINFTNAIPKNNFGTTKVPLASIGTTEVSLHIQGMEWVNGSDDDGSFVGANKSSLFNVGASSSSPPPVPYNLYVKEEGTFLLYTMGDTSTQGVQLQRGLFGALNVQPKDAEWYRSQVTAKDLALATYNANSLPAGATLSAGSCTDPVPCTFTAPGKPAVKVLKRPDGRLETLDKHPIIDYTAVYPNGATYPDGTPIPPNTPILNMLNKDNNIVHSDLTAVITGLKAGRFEGTTGAKNAEPPCNAEGNPSLGPTNGKGDPLFCANPAAPDRKQPYREVTVVYHEAMSTVTAQAFPVFSDPIMGGVVAAGKDAFAINYGTGGISAEVYANRIGVGPMGSCVDCKFEEFFLSAWSVGDPAMMVDFPANVNIQTPLPPGKAQPFVPPPPPLCTSTQLGDNPPTASNPNCVNNRQASAGTPRTGTVAFSNGSTTLTGTGTKFKTELVPGDSVVLLATPTSVRGTVKTITSDTQIILDAKAIASANGAYSIAESYTLAGLIKATKAFYPDDPSNVFHSYINDHIKFRILHGGTGVTHVHHQHAHQWLQSPNSDEGSYLDSQMISPGSSYTLEMTYNGSGNRNKVVGDSIFHCHFYPHFASGMWAMWRTHDVFESGTELDTSGRPLASARALPDGEIKAGTPIPALVPMPTIPMAPLPSDVFIDNGQVVFGTPGAPDPTGKNVTENPGFPFFIPGVAGARAPHPPFDFACQTDASGKCMTDGSGNIIYLNGGLPRHVVTGGSIAYERHNKFDWSKDLHTMNANLLPEDGTRVEKVAMQYFSRRCQSSFFPDGSAGKCPSSDSTSPQSTLNTPPTGFVLNGLPLGPQAGAPFADPAIDDNGNPVNYDKATKIQTKRIYKAAALQVNMVFNKKPIAWHYPQSRMLALWSDVEPTIDYSLGKKGRPPEPLFFRGNSGDIIEYWHTNLVPSYYLVDDFQVRTPTDILGQHIHLVKFDVTSSDGAGNGFNYEDGTFSPQEVQETIHAINKSPTNGFTNVPNKPLAPTSPPAEILDCALNPTDTRCMTCEDWQEKNHIKITPMNRPQCQSWWGAQTTIQRWYLDPLVNNSNEDRTMRTVFTHDHFGPSTHQQAGLYAGLLIEPMGSSWRNSETGQPMGRPTDQPPVRKDGGPTSWKADILTKDKDNKDVSYREFALEFQDFLLAYMTEPIDERVKQPNGTFKFTQLNPKYPFATSKPSNNPSEGYIDKKFAIGPPPGGPTLVSTAAIGSYSVNYLNEPVPYRIGSGDPSEAFNSNAAPCPTTGTPPIGCQPNAKFGGDPITPLLRAYQGDKVQVRVLVGAHMFAHQFNLEGPTWFSEPAWKNSGYRSAQAMGLSEHFEFLFNAPSSSGPNTGRKCPDKMTQGDCSDYLYSPSLDEFGVSNGLWGLFRVYDPRHKVIDPATTQVALQPLPNNPVGPSASVNYETCPDGAPQRDFYISAVTAQHALVDRSPIPGVTPKKGQIVFNDRDPAKLLSARRGLMYVRTQDLEGGKLKKGVPIEPLILRANAGDCINVYLKNEIPYGSDVFDQKLTYAAPMDKLPGVIKVAPSTRVGLHPQLLSYDAANSFGSNIGFNAKGAPNQTVAYNETVKYKWYAGKIEREASGKLNYTAVEFGTLNLFPADPLFQSSNSLFGSMVIEPAGSKWTCDGKDASGNPIQVSCDPPSSSTDFTRASATVTDPTDPYQTKTFREFVVMISDSIRISEGNISAVNYRTEPSKNLAGTQPSARYAGNPTRDFSCMLSNQLVKGEPKTPIFTADPGDNVRFRMAHPYGTGTSQVFTVHGHVWPRNPYKNSSTQIGENSLSQWLGSRDNHGATDHFELVLDSAGGAWKRPGDYLYSVYLPGQASLGAWGLFRVGAADEAWRTRPGIPGCVPPPPVAAPAPPPTKESEIERFIRQPINKDAKP
ncbi:MAG: hypothetical protein H7Z16_17075 [Pyrinomonadaceae bacterium]|nr:hypothetical protein [Pyrinomonadaceae bacterium]